ncbi:MAG: acetamidase/formamidase family protein [Firmicutes bacterium]|nr:acetamidase/formamidase family protein [Bacillota bacterium]
MLRIPSTFKTDVMSKDNKPAAYCKPGETVVFETLDCFDCAVSPDGTYDKEKGKYLANPATGPLYIEGAEPGDALEVEILSIKTRGWGAMCTGFGEFAFKNYPGENKLHVFDFSDGFVKLGDRKIPVETMIGVIGVAPAEDEIITTIAGSHGSNMDCSRIVEGARLFLPVHVPGALLAMGDMHALMGDGEVFSYGLETAGEAEVRVNVVKDANLLQPTIYQGGKVMTVASASTYDDAVRLALESMYELLLSRGWKEDEAGLLMSMKCNLVLCQIVNPVITVRAELGEEFFK